MNSRSFKTALTIVVTAILASVYSATPASAQRGRGGGGWGLEPEQQEAVWMLQSKSVAQDLALDEAASEKLLAAYKGARERIGEKVRSSFEGAEGDWRERFEKMNEIRKAERETFGEEIEGFLNEDQAGKAMETLGSFGRFWDTMTHSLSEIVTDEETLFKGTLTIGSHLAKMENSSGGDEGDREARRERWQKSREELNEALSKILNEEQLAKWKEATESRGGRRQGS
jgi:hypothetical protein